MHISEAVLATPVLVTGAIGTACGTGVGLRRMTGFAMPKTAILSAAFFVASLVHVPIGPGNIHLVLNGLLGVMLGWAAFPAILLALFLQAILFQFGGLTTLGVNTLNMALPAVVCGMIFGRSIRRADARKSARLGFFVGVLSIFGSALMVALSLNLSGDSFSNVARVIVIAHLPVMIIEGVITGFVVLFLKRVKPEIFGGSS